MFDNFWNRIRSCLVSALCHVIARAVSKIIEQENRAQGGIIVTI